MQDLKDLKRCFSRVVCSRGTGPRATVCKAVSVSRRARACPSPCSGACVRSRGTGPRATGPEGVRLTMPRSGSGEPELQSPASLLRIVQILKILLLVACGFRVGRALAGDRPPRYGPERGFLRHVPVRDQASPNYSLLQILQILKILLISCSKSRN